MRTRPTNTWSQARGIDPRRLVLYGESLGAAVAVDLASRKPVGGLVMESAFSSAVDVGQEMFRFLPARLLVRNRYESVKKIGKVQAPVLILHSRDDEFFGWHHPQRLYDAAREPKQPGRAARRTQRRVPGQQSGLCGGAVRLPRAGRRGRSELKRQGIGRQDAKAPRTAQRTGHPLDRVSRTRGVAG